MPDPWSCSPLAYIGLALDGQRVPGDHPFLVGRDDPDRDARVRGGDARAILRIGLRIELDPEPGQLLAHAPANLGRVLADARGEDEAVESPESGGKPSCLAHDAIDEVIDG